jgi:hypothetical protein
VSTSNSEDASGSQDQQGAYRRRVAKRARSQRAQTQALRLERERLQLARQVRGELRALADGAGELERQAAGGGKLAEQVRLRLEDRRRRARETLVTADRFGLDPALQELEPADRQALSLPDA